MIEQYGVLARDEGDGGEYMVLLITSRETKRWVIPRGNPIPGLSPAEAAAREAWEEAGIVGEVEASPIGSYRYEKRRPDGEVVPARVQVFVMRVLSLEHDWPEKSERERRWFTIREAAASVDEPELRALLQRWARTRG